MNSDILRIYASQSMNSKNAGFAVEKTVRVKNWKCVSLSCTVSTCDDREEKELTVKRF